MRKSILVIGVSREGKEGGGHLLGKDYWVPPILQVMEQVPLTQGWTSVKMG